MGDVALEVPLRALALSRRAERNRSNHAGVGLLGDSLDRPALAGGVASLEDHDDFQALMDYPLLQTDELHLQALELLPVASLIELPRLDLAAGERRTIAPRIHLRHAPTLPQALGQRSARKAKADLGELLGHLRADKLERRR